MAVALLECPTPTETGSARFAVRCLSLLALGGQADHPSQAQGPPRTKVRSESAQAQAMAEDRDPDIQRLGRFSPTPPPAPRVEASDCARLVIHVRAPYIYITILCKL